MSEAGRVESSAALAGAARGAFMRSHAIAIAAPPRAVFDYVTNPKSWPQWLPSSHRIDCDDRPMRFGDTFHEHWSTRTGKVELDWLVIACDPPRLWIGLTQTPFMGPIVVQYDCVVQDGGTLFTRTLWNPARPKLPTAEMVQRMDEESEGGVGEYQANDRTVSVTFAAVTPGLNQVSVDLCQNVFPDGLPGQARQ